MILAAETGTLLAEIIFGPADHSHAVSPLGFFVIGTVIFVFTFITGAIQWITSGGDKTALEGARGRISNALIGLVILFASYAIIKLIEAFFGVNILELDIGALKIE